MRILIVLPRGQEHRIRLGFGRAVSFRESPLTATMLAALVPEDVRADVAIADESVSPVPFGRRYDLVAISLLTGTAMRGYEIADHFRRRGAVVVVGGVHATLRPDEAAVHADVVVVGPAERTWPRMLRDLKAGSLRRFYRDSATGLAGLPRPRRELQQRFGYMMPNAVFATRGCRSKCSFCSVPAAGYGWSTRPVGDVVAEIRDLPSKRFVFNDVNLTDDPDYARELFTAIGRLKKQWGALASAALAKDEALIELMARSGCIYLLVGFESIDAQALRSIHKAHAKISLYADLVEKLHRHDIVIQGCFIFGLDGEGADIFDHTVEMVRQWKIDIPRYAVYTPYPGTPAYEKLQSEDRLLHQNWRYYDTQHVVFRPLGMEPRRLDAGFRWAYRKTFEMKHIRSRYRSSRNHVAIALAGNLAYRLYARRLQRDRDRFPGPPLVEQPAEGVVCGSRI